MPKPFITGTNHALPFFELNPIDFERLCYWLVTREGFERAEHLGATGSEQGRDIVAWRRGRRWAFQCKRVRSFGPADALDEVEKVLALPEDQRPLALRFLVTCAVSANTRQQVRERCAGYIESDFWDKTKLDETVKRHPEIVQEFFQVAASESTIRFTVPFPRNEDFVGRDEDLALLHQMINRGDSLVGIRPTVLVGLGGIGKTQLAVEYAHLHRDEHSAGTFWLNAVNPLLDEFALLAETLGLADRDTPRDVASRQVWAFLDDHPDALVIFDNVTEPAVLNAPVVPGLIPANLQCRTLFTTRQRDFPRNFRPFEVKVLPRDAAMRLLLRARPGALDQRHPGWGTARIICASLGWQPLALELAAAYLGQYSEVSLEGYLERLRIEGKLTTVDDTELRPEDLPTRHEVAISAVLRAQWSRLEEEETASARRLFLAAGQFPEATLLPVARLALLAGVEYEAPPGRASPLARALKQLHTVSLIEELTHDQLRLHPLVQEFAAELSPPGFRASMAERITTELGKLSRLEEHVLRRGYYETLEDLRIGMWLCEDGGDPMVRSRLANLERVLDREAHALQDWDPARHPLKLAQQLHIRAKELGMTSLAHDTSGRLSSQGAPHLTLSWSSRRESTALVRTMVSPTAANNAVTITPDGRRIIAAVGDCLVKVWDLRTGQQVRTLEGHEDAVNDVTVSRDGRSVISASNDRTVKVWDLQTGQEERSLVGHDGGVHAVAVTPDGRILSGSTDQTVRVWNRRTGEVERTLTGHGGDVKALALTPDGRVVSGSSDRTLKVWDLETGAVVHSLDGHRYGVNCCVVTPDGRIVSGANERTLKVWDLQTGEELFSLTGHEGPVFDVAVLLDGEQVVSSADDHTLRTWDMTRGEPRRTLFGHGNWVTSVAATPGGRYIVSAACDSTVKVWDLRRGDEEAPLEGHAAGINAVAVTPRGGHVVTASEDKALKVFDLATGHEEYTLMGHGGAVEAVAVTPDGDQVVSASCDHTIKIWDRQTGTATRTLRGHGDWVHAVAVTPDGERVVSGSFDGSLKVWDLQTGVEEQTLALEIGLVTAVALSHDGRWAVAGSTTGKLQIAALEPDALVAQDVDDGPWQAHKGWVHVLAMTSSGEVISCSDDATVKVQDPKKKQEASLLGRHLKRVSAVALSPDERHVISVVGSQRQLTVWDLQTGEASASLSMEAAPWCVAVAPDGETILVGDQAGCVHCLRHVGA